MAEKELEQVRPKINLLASIVVVVAALYFGRAVLVPFAVAVLLSFLLAPAVNLLERWRIWRVPAILLVTLFAFTALGMVGWVVFHEVSRVAEELPKYKTNIQARIKVVTDSFQGGPLKNVEQLAKEVTTRPATQQATAPEKPTLVELAQPEPTIFATIQEQLGTVLGPAADVAIIVIMVIFMIAEKERLRDRFIRLVGRSRMTMTTAAMDDAARRVSRFIIMQSTINGSLGLMVGVALSIIGVPNAVLWGFMVAILRFIPYIGVWIAASMPVLMSLAVTDAHSWGQPILITAVIAAMEFTTGSAIEPLLFGHSTGISPLAVLMAAIFWSWVWGGAGLLLATPLTVVLVVMGKYVPQLKFLDILLGDEPALAPATRFYQRLVAGDAEEATDVLEEQFRGKTLTQVADEVMLPAVLLAKQDAADEALDGERAAFVAQNLREMMDDLTDMEHERRTKPAAQGMVSAAREGLAAARDRVTQIAKSATGILSREAPKSEPVEGPVVSAVEWPKKEEGQNAPTAPAPCVKVAMLPAHDEWDEIAAIFLAGVLETDCLKPRVASVTRLAGEMISRIEEEGAALICISAAPPSASTYARYLHKRISAKFPETPIVVAMWGSHTSEAKLRERLRAGDSTKIVTTIADAELALTQLAQGALLKINAAGAEGKGAAPLAAAGA